MTDQSGRAPSGQALVVPTEPASSLGPSGFDPSRAWRTDKPPFMSRPIYQFVLLEGYEEHSGRTWHRLFAGTATISAEPGNRWGYRREDIDRIQRDGGMDVVERIKGWVPASFPRWDWFIPAAQGIEAAPADETRSGSAEGESPVLGEDAPNA